MQHKSNEPCEASQHQSNEPGEATQQQPGEPREAMQHNPNEAREATLAQETSKRLCNVTLLNSRTRKPMASQQEMNQLIEMKHLSLDKV
jgi:hypothetical protein